jgi:hypothetical protein
VFLFSGLSKLLHPAEFRSLIAQLFPNKDLRTIVFALPLVEILLVIFSQINEARIVSKIIMIFLISCFIYISIKYLLSGRKNLQCNCFGKYIPEKLGIETLIKNLFLITITIFSTIYSKPIQYNQSLDSFIMAMTLSFGVFCSYAIIKNTIYLYSITLRGNK